MLDAPSVGTPPPETKSGSLLTCAGADQQVVRSLHATLDAQCSRLLASASSDTLWRQTGGSRVTLQSAVTTVARFAAPLGPDALDFQVEQQTRDASVLDQARIEVVSRDAKSAPLAIGSGDVVAPSDRVLLDASASLALLGGVVTYRWRQVAGAPVIIDAPESAVTAVTIGALASTAAFAVEVQDSSLLWSEPEFVVLHPAGSAAVPTTPVLSAPRVVTPGALVSIELPPASSGDGSGVWLRQLRGEPVALDRSDPQRVRFVAPRAPQQLVFRCDVERQGVRARPAVALIRVSAGVGNRAPVAEAGPDRRVRPAQTVAVDGSASSDPDGTGSLEYHWSQTAGPLVELTCTAARCLLQTPAGAGSIALALVVSDGMADSAPDVVVLTIDPAAANLPPVASAGGERWALPASVAVLDGSRSDDPDSGAIASFLWRQLDDGSPRAQLDAIDQAQLRLIAPATSGDLWFELTVCDTDQACAVDTALLHVQLAGPYVDANLGQDTGDGTAAAPLRTVEQGLLQATRFGLPAVRIAAGDYLLADALTVPAGLALQGGLVHDGAGYRLEPTAVTRLTVADAEVGVVLETGASLERLTVDSAAAITALTERRLIVLGPRTRCNDLVATGPDTAATAIAVDVLEGASVSIARSDLRGGTASGASYALRARSDSAVELTGSSIGIGSGGRYSAGIVGTDSAIAISSCALHLQSAAGGASAASVVGLEQHGGVLGISGSEISLGTMPAAPAVESAVAVQCDGCALQVDSGSVVHGPRELAAGALGIGCRLQGVVSAVLDGITVGGAASPAATLIALDLQDATVDLRAARLSAASDGEAARGYALRARQIRGRVALAAADSVARAIAAGILLSATSDLDLEVDHVSAVADTAAGVVDGRDLDLVGPANPSVGLALTIGTDLSAVGSSRATGVELHRTSSSQLALAVVSATAVDTSTGIWLDDSDAILAPVAQISATADRGPGRATAVLCEATATLRHFALARSRLVASAGDATALDLAGCSVDASVSVLLADGARTARGVVSTGPVLLNGVLIEVRGGAGTGCAIDASATLQLINSALDLNSQSGTALALASSADQAIALHHLLFAPVTAPLLAVAGSMMASDAASLAALRPRFTDLRQVGALLIDDSGHISDPGSPAIDAADPATASREDIDGDLRPVGAGPDIGPDEYR